MVDFKEELRKRCRNPKCQMNLREPVSNPREAFCVAGCYRAFYRSRCLICEEVLERKNEQQKVCGKRKCRSTLRALQKDGLALGRYFPRSMSEAPQKTLDFIDSKTAAADDRAALSATCFDGDAEIVPFQGKPWLPKGLAKATPNGEPAWQWHRMTGPNGETRIDDDWELLDRDGNMAARIRQEGDGYWLARPRVKPEPPIESLKAACERAVMVAMAILDPYPETERHPLHPGMTASQFKATCRGKIEQRVVAILKPPAIESGLDRSALIRNAIETESGGHEWRKVVSPDGVVCYVAKGRPTLEKAAKKRQLGGLKKGDDPVAPTSARREEDDRSGRVDHQIAQLGGVAAGTQSQAQTIPDDLSIPAFLRRDPPQADDLPLAA